MAKTKEQTQLEADMRAVDEIRALVEGAPLNFFEAGNEVRQVEGAEEVLRSKKSDLPADVYRQQTDLFRAKKEAKRFDPVSRRRAVLEFSRRKAEIRALTAANLERWHALTVLEKKGASSPELLHEREVREELRKVLEATVRFSEHELYTTACPTDIATEFTEGEKYLAQLNAVKVPSGWLGNTFSNFRDGVRVALAELKRHLSEDDSNDLVRWASSRK